MAKVLLEMSVSLDGYLAGPDVSPVEPMGRGGERLHEWMFQGRRWGEEPTFHAPVFVVTNRPAETIVKAGGTSYTFVTSGIDDAPSSS